jgi:hypothetical protein
MQYSGRHQLSIYLSITAEFICSDLLYNRNTKCKEVKYSKAKSQTGNATYKSGTPEMVWSASNCLDTIKKLLVKEIN